jgi:hypothetical protein
VAMAFGIADRPLHEVVHRHPKPRSEGGNGGQRRVDHATLNVRDIWLSHAGRGSQVGLTHFRGGSECAHSLAEPREQSGPWHCADGLRCSLLGGCAGATPGLPFSRGLGTRTPTGSAQTATPVLRLTSPRRQRRPARTGRSAGIQTGSVPPGRYDANRVSLPHPPHVGGWPTPVIGKPDAAIQRPNAMAAPPCVPLVWCKWVCQQNPIPTRRK